MNMHWGFINILFNLLYQFTGLFVRLLCVQLQEGNYGLINSLSRVSSYGVNTREGQTHALGSLSLVSVPAKGGNAQEGATHSSSLYQECQIYNQREKYCSNPTDGTILMRAPGNFLLKHV